MLDILEQCVYPCQNGGVCWNHSFPLCSFQTSSRFPNMHLVHIDQFSRSPSHSYPLLDVISYKDATIALLGISYS
jgi:hypothetical protein